MKLKTLLATAAVAAALTLSSGCTSNPINEPSALVAIPTDAEHVRQAISIAAANRGWSLKEVGPNELEGSLNLRQHVAVVKITYDAKSFNIAYKDSINLDADLEKKTIHRNYNRWVNNLRAEILQQLATTNTP